MGLEAIVLAGGQGTRLKPAIGDLPKPLAPVAGRPFICILLDLLEQRGFARVILATGYRGNLIRDTLGDSYGSMELIHSLECEPLGTGGAIALAMTHLKGTSAIVINGDTWLEAPFHALAEVANTGDLAMTAKFMNDTGRYGSLKIENERIYGLLEKTGNMPGWINAGCYGIPASLQKLLPVKKHFSFERDFLPGFLAVNGARMLTATGDFCDIGIPEDYAKFRRWAESQCNL